MSFSFSRVWRKISTNLFFFGRWGTDLVSPAGNHLGIFEVLVPVVGALMIYPQTSCATLATSSNL